MVAATFALIAGVLAQAAPTPPDVNGDGVAEYAEFAPNSADLRVIDGATNAAVWTAARPTCSASPSSTHLWWSDLDVDGVTDVLVSRTRCPLTNSVGEIEALAGTTGATLWLLEGASDLVFTGTMALVSDQTWDGVPELLAGLGSEGTAGTAIIDGRRGVLLDTLPAGLSEVLAADEQGIRLFTPADVDLSGSVNGGDFDLLLDWYSNDDIRADIDGDGFWTPIDIQGLIDEMTAGVMTIRGFIASTVNGGAQPCTASLVCSCGIAEASNAVPTQGICDQSQVDVEVSLDCTMPGKPKATITGFLPPAAPASYMQTQVCTTFERLGPNDTIEATHQFPGLLPQHVSGAAYDDIMSTPGRWRVTTVVAWCFNGGWCCTSDECEFVTTSVPGDNADPCIGGSLCTFIPGEVHGLPESCMPGTGSGMVDSDPIFVVPGQRIVLTIERGTLVGSELPGCPGADPLAAGFEGEESYDVIEHPPFPETGSGGVLEDDECEVLGATIIVPAEWLPGMGFSLTVRMGHTGCEVHEVTYFFMISPDNDGDRLLDCFESNHTCPNFNMPDSDGDGVLDGDEVALAGLAFHPDRCAPADPRWSFFNPCDPNLPHELDHDRDGISTVNELARFGSNPLAFDTDRGGGQDTAELELFSVLPSEDEPAGRHFNPRLWYDLRETTPVMRDHDRDEDGLFDRYEFVRGWDTNSSDQDGDGIRDGLEMRFPELLGPEAADQGPTHPSLPTDSDRDGLSDDVERRMSTNPRDPDSDNDGVSDGAESAMGLDPMEQDSDGDGTEDGDLDFDGDGVSNADERLNGLNPGDSDTDGDGTCDSNESWTAPDYNGNLLDSMVSNGARCTVGAVCVQPGHRWPDGTISYTIYPDGILGPCSGQCIETCYVAPVGGCHALIATHACPDAGGPWCTGAVCQSAWNQPTTCGGTLVPLSGPERCFGPAIWLFCVDFPLDEGETADDLNVDPQDVFPPGTLQPANPDDPSDPRNQEGRDDIYDSNGDGETDYRDAPIAVDIDIGSNSSGGETDRNESKEGEPGMAMLASTFDADGDNIPDYADGFNLFGNRVPGTSRASESAPVRELDNFSPHKMIPVTVQIRGILANPPERDALPGTYHSQRISFEYDGSDPHRVGKSPGDLFDLPASGRYRLWARFYDRYAPPTPPQTRTPVQLANDIVYGNSMIPSADQRPNDNVTECDNRDHHERHLDSDRDGDGDIDGDDQLIPNPDGTDITGIRYLHPGQQYELIRLGITPWSNNATITIWLEPIAHSEEVGDLITAQVHASGNNTVAPYNACDTPAPDQPNPEFGYKDCVAVTAVSMGFASINSDGTLGQMQSAVPVSYVTPTFTPINFFVENIEIDPSDSRKLRADLRVYASLDDAVADLVPGVEGTIQAVGVLLNDQPLPGFNGEGELVIPVFPQKSTGSNNPLAPFDFTGQIASISELRDVEVQAGTNRLRLLAMNARDNVGWIEWTFTIDARENEPFALLAEIDTEGVNLEGEPGEQLILRVVPPALANDPAAWTTRTLTWTGEPREFEDDSLRMVLDFAAPTPTAVDTLTATLYEHGAVDPTLTVVLNETDVNTTIFRGPVPLSDPPSGTWEGHAISLSTSRPIASTNSTGGMPNRFVIEFKGPAPTDAAPTALLQMQEVFDRLIIGDVEYPLIQYGGRLVLRQSQHPDLVTPAVMMATPSTQGGTGFGAGSSGGPPVNFRLERSETPEFIDGFGEGLVATGVDFWEGTKRFVVGVGRAIGRASDYVYVVEFELRRGEFTAIRADFREIGVKIKKAAETLGVIAEVMAQLVQDADLFYEALVLREEAAIEALGEEYGLYLEIVAELVEATRALARKLSPRDYGFAAGRLTGEVAVEVASSVVTGGLATAVKLVNKSEKLVRIATRLTPDSNGGNVEDTAKELLDVVGLSKHDDDPEVLSGARTAVVQILEVVNRSQQVITSRMCFVAGTLVWTATGLQPIECVREGDLVLSRSTITGESEWKPVTKTFVTHPAELVRIVIASGGQDSNERIETITGTPEHPVWVKERREFVGLGSLVVGQHLERADRGPACILSVTTTRGPPLSETRSAPQPSLHGWTGSRFTTYNLEVADFHTYFVGESGVWVHNRGPFCKRMVNLSLKLASRLPLGPGGRFNLLQGASEAFDAFMQPRRALGKPDPDRDTLRNIYIGLGEDIVADRFATGGGVDYRRAFPYNAWRNWSTRLRETYGTSFALKTLRLSFNHGSPKKWTERMWERMRFSDPGNPTWNGPSNDVLNNQIPCFPMKNERHYAGRGVVRPDGTYEPTFHDLIEGNSQPDRLVQSVFDRSPALDRTNPAHIRLAIKRAHDRMQQLYGDVDEVNYSAMGEIVDNFLLSKGIP